MIVLIKYIAGCKKLRIEGSEKETKKWSGKSGYKHSKNVNFEQIHMSNVKKRNVGTPSNKEPKNFNILGDMKRNMDVQVKS